MSQGKTTPEGSNISFDKLYEALDNGRTYGQAVDKAVEVINGEISRRPDFDIHSLSDYSQMKEMLAMEVVSAETNAEMLATLPHQNIEDMAVVYRFVLNSDEVRASILMDTHIIMLKGN